MRQWPTWLHDKVETAKFITAKKCFDNKNVVVASSDTETHSVVQGDGKTTNTQKKKKM